MKKVLITLLGLVVLLALFSCQDEEDNKEYLIWKSSLPGNPQEFVNWWNKEGKNAREWKFSLYGENGLTYPDYSSAVQIFNSKLINCNRMTTLLEDKYTGYRMYIDQPGDTDHVIFVFILNGSYCFVSYPNGGNLPYDMIFKDLKTNKKEQAEALIHEIFNSAKKGELKWKE